LNSVFYRVTKQPDDCRFTQQTTIDGQSFEFLISWQLTATSFLLPFTFYLLPHSSLHLLHQIKKAAAEAGAFSVLLCFKGYGLVVTPVAPLPPSHAIAP
jgi:hypothetical protein